MSLGNDFTQPLRSSLELNRGLASGTNIVRHALRDGRRAVTFRTSETPTGTAVECDVHAQEAGVLPRTIGPYTFSTHAEARNFGDDLMRALDYLGLEDCELVEDER